MTWDFAEVNPFLRQNAQNVLASRLAEMVGEKPPIANNNTQRCFLHVLASLDTFEKPPENSAWPERLPRQLHATTDGTLCPPVPPSLVRKEGQEREEEK